MTKRTAGMTHNKTSLLRRKKIEKILTVYNTAMSRGCVVAVVDSREVRVKTITGGFLKSFCKLYFFSLSFNELLSC